jgi:hypothetical protein
MSEKLFYNVSKDKANDFKSSTTNAIGFVEETDNAGYIIANGKEYGKTRVSSSNSFSVNGTEYSIIVDETGALSVSKYIATSISSVNLTSLSATKTTLIDNVSTTSVEKYVGTAYSFKVGIDITSTSQEIKVNVSNATGNKYKLAVHDGTSYIFSDTDYRTTNGVITCTSNSVMADVAPVDSESGAVVAWAETKLSKDTTGEKTFTVYLTESGKTTLTKTATQSNINVTVSITPKVPFLYGKTGEAAGCTTLIKDIKYGSVGTFDQNFTFNEGDIPTFAIASCVDKTLKCFNDTGALEDTSLTKIATAQQLTLNGCTTKYDIYRYGSKPWVGSATIKVKY